MKLFKWETFDGKTYIMDWTDIGDIVCALGFIVFIFVFMYNSVRLVVWLSQHIVINWK